MKTHELIRLRNLSEERISKIILRQIQADIPEIVERLLKESDNQHRPSKIKNNFPVMKCNHCGSDSFKIQAHFQMELNYGKRSRQPILESYDFPEHAEFECKNCRNFIDFKDPENQLFEIIRRVNDRIL